MSDFKLHPEAFNDIDEIRAHLAEDNPDAADTVVTASFDRIGALVAFPHQGYRRPNLTSSAFLVVHNLYRIAYDPSTFM